MHFNLSVGKERSLLPIFASYKLLVCILGAWSVDFFYYLHLHGIRRTICICVSPITSRRPCHRISIPESPIGELEQEYTMA